MKRATTFVCGEKQPAANRVLPTLAKLRIEMAVNEKVDLDLARAMKENIIDNLNSRYRDINISSFLLKASFLDPIYKSLNNIAKESAVFVTKQAVRDMCILVAEKQSKLASASNTEKLLDLPSLSASAAVKVVKVEPPAEPIPHASNDMQLNEPPMKKIKLESDDYDDWLRDVIYIGSEHVENQTSHSELINKELEKNNPEPQIKGDPLEWRKSREGSMPILAEVVRGVLCTPGTSVPSERVFSKSGHLLNKKKSFS